MHKAVLKLSFKFLVLGILSGGLWFFYSGFAVSQTSPQLIAARQPDSPLLIQPMFVNASNPLRPRYKYSLMNIGNKPIRAYAIQESVRLGEGESPTVYTEFVHIPAVKLYLKPNETREEVGGRGSIFQSPPIRVELSVDFIEFTDGTRWGADTSKSGEQLDGMRAGGRAAVKKYREVLTTKGIDSLELAIGNEDLIQPDNQLRSPQWTEGFRMGVSFVRNQVSKAKVMGGEEAVKRELEKPFDSTEGRQEP